MLKRRGCEGLGSGGKQLKEMRLIWPGKKKTDYSKEQSISGLALTLQTFPSRRRACLAAQLVFSWKLSFHRPKLQESS